jgi:competence protein ComEA
VIRIAQALAVALALLAAGPAAAKGKPLGAGEKIDVNGAAVEELMRLPGIGRKRAEAIAALRAKRPFRRVDDVAQVKGISPGWVAKHRALLEAAPPAVVAAAAAKPAGKP